MTFSSVDPYRRHDTFSILLLIHFLSVFLRSAQNQVPSSLSQDAESVRKSPDAPVLCDSVSPRRQKQAISTTQQVRKSVSRIIFPVCSHCLIQFKYFIGTLFFSVFTVYARERSGIHHLYSGGTDGIIERNDLSKKEYL